MSHTYTLTHTMVFYDLVLFFRFKLPLKVSIIGFLLALNFAFRFLCVECHVMCLYIRMRVCRFVFQTKFLLLFFVKWFVALYMFVRVCVLFVKKILSLYFVYWKVLVKFVLLKPFEDESLKLCETSRHFL